jgi:PAS domain S-box-containing protein
MEPLGPSYVWTLLLSGTLSAIVGFAAVASLRGYSRTVQTSFAGLTFAGSLWATGYALHYAVPGTSASFWWFVAVVGSLAVPPLWLVFVFAYTGRENRLTLVRVGVLVVEPVLVLVGLVADAPKWTSAGPPGSLAGIVWSQTPFGSVLLAHVFYGVGIGLFSVVVLLRMNDRNGATERVRRLLLLGAAAIPPAAFVAGPVTAGLVGGRLQDPAPLFVGVSAAIGFLALAQNQRATPGLHGGAAGFWSDALATEFERGRPRPDALDGRPQGLVEYAREIISVHDVEGNWLYASPSVTESLGYEPGFLIDRNAFDIVHPADRPHVQSLFASVADEGEPERARFRVRHANGSWRRYDAVAAPLFDDPTSNGIVVSTRDVTTQDRHEQRVRVVNRVLRHDLRNGMNVVLGNAGILLESDLPPEAAERVQTIRRRALSLVDLGERFRRIDRAMDDSLAAQHPIDVVETLDQVLDRYEADHPSVTVHRDFPPATHALADDLLDVALANVVENAIVHNDTASPTLRASVDTDVRDGREAVVVAVEDDGPGLDDHQRNALELGTETPLEHTDGLGLWLVRWIIEESAGQLAFRENDPRGTVVEITLELADLA